MPLILRMDFFLTCQGTHVWRSVSLGLRIRTEKYSEIPQLYCRLGLCAGLAYRHCKWWICFRKHTDRPTCIELRHLYSPAIPWHPHHYCSHPVVYVVQHLSRQETTIGRGRDSGLSCIWLLCYRHSTLGFGAPLLRIRSIRSRPRQWRMGKQRTGLSCGPGRPCLRTNW